MRTRSLANHAPASRSRWLVIALAAFLRLLVFALTDLPDTLSTRPELSTPLTSYRSLREGVFVYERGSNPYDGGVFYHSPLYLALFTRLIPISSYATTSAVWIIVDAVGAWALTVIVDLRQSRGREAKSRSSLVAAVYLFNPYTFMSCLSRTSTSIEHSLLLVSLASATKGRLMAMILLAVVSHSSLYPVVLLPSFVQLVSHNAGRTRSALATLAFLISFLGLGAVNCFALGSTWVSRTWGIILGVHDLTPNVGMWWYLVTEMFDHFRPFFVGVFHLHPIIYVLPLATRLRHDPLLVIMITMGIFATWKSYPTLGDLGLWAGLLSCFPEVVSNLRHPLFTLTVYLYTLILLPLLHALWLSTGTGNANFFYAATMVHGLNSSLAIVDVLGASIRGRIRMLAKREGSLEWDDRWQIVQLNKAM